MRFCQTDGTVLTENAPAEDPYKTVVGNQSDIAAAIPPLDPFKTMVAIPPPKLAEEDLLQLPKDSDQLKTMVVSQDELREELKDEGVPPLDLPPTYAPSAPLIEPKPPTPNDFSSAPSSGDAGLPKPSTAFPSDAPAAKNPSGSQGSPPSPFDSKPFENDFSAQSPYGNQENKPIPSPFQDSMPPGYQPPTASPFDTPPASSFDAPLPPPFKEPEPAFGNQPESAFQPPTPFGQPEPVDAPMQQTGWTPPPAPASSGWGSQNQELNANTPVQMPAGGKQDQTLAIVSLVCGILSIFCCFSIIVPIAAVVLGFIAKGKIDENPNEYGGRGLALAGMITGGIGLILGIIVIILQLFGGLIAGLA